MTHDTFVSLLSRLRLRAKVEISTDQKEKYWEALKQRIQGNLRWDRVAPFVLPREGVVEDQVAFSLSQHNVPNILRRLPFVGFTIDSICYVIDVFNPQDELDLKYVGAGETVVALLLHEIEWDKGTVSRGLVDNSQFYSILREFDEILSPRVIVGMGSSTLATCARAYVDHRVPSTTSPWSFLYPLTVTTLPKPIGDVSLGRYFKYIEHWRDDRILLQIKSGLDNLLSRAYIDAAKILGMRAIQELHPDI